MVLDYNSVNSLKVDMSEKLTLEQERDLIEKAKTDWSAFEDIYKYYVNEIYYYLLGRLKSKEIAEDMTSETFTKALENIKKFQWQGVPFRAWLYRIAINCANQNYQKSSKEQLMDPDDMSYIKGGDDTNIKDEIDQNIEKEKLKKALNKLSSYEKDIIELRYFQELSYEEIAEAMEMSVTLVGVKIHRILKKLQAYI